MRSGTLLGLLLAATSTTLSAQTVASIEPGDRVRIQAEEVSGEFELMEVSADYLVVSDQLRVPISSISSLDVSISSRRQTLKGALIGGGIGLVGALVTRAAWQSDDECDEPVGDIFCDIASDVVLVWMPTLGLGVGALLGTLMVSDLWQQIPLQEQMSIAPSRDGGVALGYEYRF